MPCSALLCGDISNISPSVSGSFLNNRAVILDVINVTGAKSSASKITADGLIFVFIHWISFLRKFRLLNAFFWHLPLWRLFDKREVINIRQSSRDHLV